ncbi:MAG: lamin tail domain-containing protein [Rikenellaceae bacterium]|nr:lamin tail domain-containing protein [Rikenellaceae bacterium]
MKNILLAALAAIILLPGCVKDDQYEGPAVIEKITFNPSSPMANQAITVTCKITDLNGVTGAILKYSVNSGQQQSVTMTEGSERTYSAVIPGQTDNADIKVVIEADNTKGFKAISEEKSIKVAPPVLVYVNECDPNAKSMELYNDMTSAVDLSGWVIRKDGSTEAKNNWTIPTGVTIAAKGYLVITQDPNGVTGFTFGMSATKGFSYTLFDANGATRDFLDNLTNKITAGASPNTIGRLTDGATQIVLFTVGSMGKSNSTGTR